MPKPQPWSAADATEEIRKIARDAKLKLTLTGHARDQMAERDLIVSDVLYVLKNGFVYANAEKATQEGFFKYLPESRSPNSGNRTVRVVAIPDAHKCWIKVATVMWVDGS